MTAVWHGRWNCPPPAGLRRYRVRAFGTVDQKRLDALAQGITIEGERFGPIDAELERVQGGNTWLTLTFAEGRNREVKRVLGALGLKVNRLIRTDYGPFTLGELARGTAEEVSRADIMAATASLRAGNGPVRLRAAHPLAQERARVPAQKAASPRAGPRPRRNRSAAARAVAQSPGNPARAERAAPSAAAKPAGDRNGKPGRGGRPGGKPGGKTGGRNAGRRR